MVNDRLISLALTIFPVNKHFTARQAPAMPGGKPRVHVLITAATTLSAHTCRFRSEEYFFPPADNHIHYRLNFSNRHARHSRLSQKNSLHKGCCLTSHVPDTPETVMPVQA